jgi:hypothetical protein
MKRRLKVEVDLEKIIDNAIEMTIAEGLNADKEEMISEYSKETFDEMQTDYRYYGALFGINFKENLEKEFENIIKEN